jgi:nucleoside phosphorylase
VTGVGNSGAAVIAERAIAMFRPRAVLIVGAVGGLHGDLRLGDVVVGTRVYAHQGGREEDSGFLARPQAWHAPHDLEQLARNIARNRLWTPFLVWINARPATTQASSSISTCRNGRRRILAGAISQHHRAA